jgi:tetratricopeptide (TPR) repeat protein
LDWVGAERGFKRALELNANKAGSHQSYSMYLLCAGRYEEAVSVSLRGQELDPLSLSANTMVGFALFISGRYDEAIDKLKSILEMNPNFSWANSVLGEVYEQKGMYTESFDSYKKAIEFYGENPSLFMGFLGYAYARGGQKEEAAKVLSQLNELTKQEYVSPYALGVIHLGLGQKDQAFALFEQAAEERTTMMTSLKFDHRMDSIRSDPRFKSLLKKMNLE